MKRFIAFLLIAILLALTSCTGPGDPYPDDAYFGDLYSNGVLVTPGIAAPHNVLSATHPDTTIGAVVRGDLITGQAGPTWNKLALGAPGTFLKATATDIVWGTELDPVFSGSPAFGITALNIIAWNASIGDMTKAVYDPANIGEQLVGLTSAQSLTNKQLTMNNADPIKWKTAGGVPQDTITLLASNILQITNASGSVQVTGGAINLNTGVNEEIYMWGSGVGTGRELVLYGNSADVVNTLRDSPTINLAAYYWDGGAAVGWPGQIIHDMVTAGAVPKSQIKFSINSVSILRLENNNGVVKTLSDGVLDMVTHSVRNIQFLNMATPTTLTIAAGAITVTQGFHLVDTQGGASTDDLDTINGGTIGDLLTFSSVNSARNIAITCNGNIRFSEEHQSESFGFVSPSGTSGTFYTAGYYAAPAADANLTQASTTVTYGSANAPEGAHAFLVSKQAGTTNAGTVSIVISGVSITDAGVRAAGATETLIANITTMGNNSYYQTTKKWLGTVTWTLTPVGGAITYAADFNYGFATSDNFSGRLFTIEGFEVMGRAGANDTGFNITLLQHVATGWTYSAAAFVPGSSTFICDLVTDYATDNDLVTNERFKYERTNLNTYLDGLSAMEGFIIKVTTTANRAVEFLNATVYVGAIPNTLHLNNSNQSIGLIYNGTNWVEN